MTNTKKTKLKLNRETLLSTRALGAVGGGYDTQLNTCFCSMLCNTPACPPPPPIPQVSFNRCLPSDVCLK
jgi:hypothetical protein